MAAGRNGLRDPTDSAANGCSKSLTDRGYGDAVEDLLEEAGYHQPSCLVGGEAAGLGVEDLFFVDPSARGTVGAANIIGFDFQARNRIGSG